MPTNTGNRYDRDLDVKEIAKRIRAGLKRRTPGYKWSVRIDRFSGGQSIDITLKAVPAGVAVLNPKRILWELEMGQPWDPYQSPQCLPGYVSRWGPSVSRVLRIAQGLHRAYNYDDSDSMTDYFSVNYYGSVEVDWDLRNADRERQRFNFATVVLPELERRAAQARMREEQDAEDPVAPAAGNAQVAWVDALLGSA